MKRVLVLLALIGFMIPSFALATGSDDLCDRQLTKQEQRMVEYYQTSASVNGNPVAIPTDYQHLVTWSQWGADEYRYDVEKASYLWREMLAGHLSENARKQTERNLRDSARDKIDFVTLATTARTFDAVHRDDRTKAVLLLLRQQEAEMNADAQLLYARRVSEIMHGRLTNDPGTAAEFTKLELDLLVWHDRKSDGPPPSYPEGIQGFPISLLVTYAKMWDCYFPAYTADILAWMRQRLDSYTDATASDGTVTKDIHYYLFADGLGTLR